MTLVKQSRYEEMKRRVDPVWSRFCLEFPDEDACRLWYAEQLRSSHVLRCHHCQSESVDVDADNRSCFCFECGGRSWLTSGSFFHKVKQLRTWLGAIYIMDCGELVSANYFAKLSDVSISTAIKIIKSVSFAIDKTDFDGKAKAVSSKHFVEAFCKRSIATPAFSHPRQEEGAELERGNVELNYREHKETQVKPDARFSQEFFDLDEVEKMVLHLLRQGARTAEEIGRQLSISPQILAGALSLLEINGLIESTAGNIFRAKTLAEDRMHFDSATSAGSREDARCRRMASYFNRVVDFIFSGISRKYLQLYVSLINFCRKKRKRQRAENRSLFWLCMRHDAVSQRQILGFVTPPVVVFF